MDELKIWAKAAAIRAIKTFAQTAAAMIPVAVMITEVDWIVVASTSATAAILSILTSIAGLPEVKLTEEIDTIEQEVDSTNAYNENLFNDLAEDMRDLSDLD